MSEVGRIGIGPGNAADTEIGLVVVDHNPRTTNTDASAGSLIIRGDTGELFRKLDDGSTTNVASMNTVYNIDAEQFDNPNNSDWTVNSLARLSKDTLNAGVPVRRFDDSSEEGVGASIWVPAGMTSVILGFAHRPQAAGAGDVVLSVHSRNIPVAGGTVTSWTAGTNLAAFVFPASTNWLYDSETVTLSSLGIVADAWNQLEITRDFSAGGDNLVGDYVLRSMRLEFI